MSALTERMAALRLDSKPIPLKVFITIYLGAKSECYTNYMRGALDLHTYLTSHGLVPLDWEIPTDASLPAYPDILHSYDIQELAYIITGNDPARHALARNIIIHTILSIHKSGI